MKIYEDIEAERERIQNCIQKYGWTSDHNLDWFIDGLITKDYVPAFVDFEDGTGILIAKNNIQWRMWSDPLSSREDAPRKILELCTFAFAQGVKEMWCDDVSGVLYPILSQDKNLRLDTVYYSLFWPILDMEKYDLLLRGGNFKEIRNARNKFYREHKLEIINSTDLSKDALHNIIEEWKKAINGREDIYDLKYHTAIENGFQGFVTTRALVVDGRPVGINAGYEIPNYPGRFAGVIGIHDYSIKDLGIILWLEDLEWIKNTSYKEVDLQGTQDNQELKFKMQFNPVIERKTDCFAIHRG